MGFAIKFYLGVSTFPFLREDFQWFFMVLNGGFVAGIFCHFLSRIFAMVFVYGFQCFFLFFLLVDL